MEADEYDDELIESGMLYGHQVIRRAKYDKLQAENERLKKGLIKLRDCDFVITLPDRMDAVRAIAKAALEGGDGD